MKRNDKLWIIIFLSILTLFIFFDEVRLFSIIISLINIFLGIYIYRKNFRYNCENKNYFIVLGILNIFSLKFVSAITYFIIYSEYNRYSLMNNWNNLNTTNDNYNAEYNKPKQVIDPQIRKVDILLKLGVGMVFISGLIFATTGWASLNSIIKLILLLLVSGVFIGLSKFCEKKLKIKSTIYLYWFLGMAFLVLTFLNVGSNNLFGTYFSLNGDGFLLYNAFLAFIVLTLSLATYLNFKNKVFLPITYASFTVVLFFIFAHFNINMDEFATTLIAIFTITRIIKFKNDLSTLNTFSNIVVLVAGISFILFEEGSILTFIMPLLIIFNLYLEAIRDKKQSFNSAVPALTFFTVLKSLYLFLDKELNFTIILTIVSFVIYLASFLIDSDILKKSSLITSNILLLFLFLIAFEDNKFSPLLVSIVLLLIYGISYFLGDEDSKRIELSFELMKIFIFCLGFFYIISEQDFIGWSLVSSMIASVAIMCLSKNKKRISVYCTTSLILAIISLWAAIFNAFAEDVRTAICTFITVVSYYGYIYFKGTDKKEVNILAYMLLLVVTFVVPFILQSILGVGLNNNVYGYEVSICLYLLIALIHRNDDFKVNVSLLALILPIFGIILQLSGWQVIVLISLLVYYSTFVLSRLFRNNSSASTVASYVGYIISFLLVVFTDDAYVLAYLLILLFISLLRGYLNKKDNSLFYVSVGSLIITIIYQLRSFWKLLPAWLYLLVVGLAFIVFATYKQVKILENNKKKEDK